MLQNNGETEIKMYNSFNKIICSHWWFPFWRYIWARMNVRMCVCVYSISAVCCFSFAFLGSTHNNLLFCNWASENDANFYEHKHTHTHTCRNNHAEAYMVLEWETNNYPYRHLTTHGMRSSNVRMDVNLRFLWVMMKMKTNGNSVFFLLYTGIPVNWTNASHIGQEKNEK